MRLNFTFVLMAAVLLAPQTSQAAGQVTVTLASGRRFVAQVARADDHKLWLRFGTASAVVLRPVSWQKIDRMQVEGEDVPPERRQARAKALAQAAAEAAAAEAAAAEADEVPPPANRAPRNDPPPAPDLAGPRLPARSLAVEAFAANWDGDPELDGLEVRIHPLDEYGREVAVGGTLEVILLADLPGRFPLRHRRTPREVRTERIGRWVKAVDASDFGPAGAVYRLPYQAIDPQFNPDSGPTGSVYVQLSVPGQGTFQRTITDIRTRPYSAHRDFRQQRGENRFFGVERTGRNKPAAGR